MSIFVYKKEVPAVGAYYPVLELHCFHNIKLKNLCKLIGIILLQLVPRNKFKSYLIFLCKILLQRLWVNTTGVMINNL